MREAGMTTIFVVLLVLCITMIACTATNQNSCDDTATPNCYANYSNQGLRAFPGDVPRETQILNLEGNDISNLMMDDILPLTHLRELKLGGNPLNCDCNMRWLYYAAINQYHLFENLVISGAVCQTPGPLRDRELSNLTRTDFLCQEPISSVNCYVCGLSEDCSDQSLMTCPMYQDRCKTVEFVSEEGSTQLQQFCSPSSSCPEGGASYGECASGRGGTCATQCCQGDMCNFFLPRDLTPKSSTSPIIPVRPATSSARNTPTVPPMSTKLTTTLVPRISTKEETTTAPPTSTRDRTTEMLSTSTTRTTSVPKSTRESTVQMTEPIIITESVKIYCEAEVTSDNKGIVEWPTTEANNDTIIIRPCPFGPEDGNSEFMIGRKCLLSSSKAEWSVPDTGGCKRESQSTKDDRFNKIANMTIEPEQAEAVSGQLSRLTTESRDFDADDVSTSVDIVDKILDSQVNGTDVDVAQNVLQIVNNLLNAGSDVLAASEEQDDSASRMIKAVEQVSQGIVVQGNESLVVTTRSISLTVVAIDGNHFDGLEFGVYSAEDGRGGSTFSRHEGLPKENLQSEIYLPPTIFQDVSTEEQSRIATAQFISYKTNALFHIVESSADSSPQSANMSSSNDTVLASPVIAASTGDVTITNLDEPVTIKFRKDKEVPYKNPKCVFWDFTGNGGKGGWSGHGCILAVNKTETDNDVVCHCNHLTHFALLMDVYDEADDIDSANQKALTFISYIGCGISLFALILTLLNLVFCSRRKDKQVKIMINLCFALFMTMVMFLTNALVVDFAPIIPELCITMAVLLHYFALAVFVWSALEAVHVYLLVIRIFRTFISRFMTKFCIIGWGVPLVVTVVTVAVDVDHYGYHSMFCWLSRYPFYGSFLAPLCLILIFNTVIYCLVVNKICGLNSKGLTAYERFKVQAQLRAAVGLLVLLGLTWVFAIFAVGEARLVFSYLFAVCNSLQGLFIFIFHCLLNKEVRNRWRTVCACHKEEYDTKESNRKSLSSYSAEKYQVSTTDQTSFRLDSSSMTSSPNDYTYDKEDFSTFRSE